MHSNKHIRDLGNTKSGNCSFKEPKLLRTKHRCQPRGWILRKIKARDKRNLSISLDYVIVMCNETMLALFIVISAAGIGT